MNTLRTFRTIIMLLATVCFCCPVFGAENLPHTVLWAWQRAEDLSNLNPDEFAVAYLACTVTLGERIVSSPRVQPLKVPEKMRMLPVIRIDTDRLHPPPLSDSQADLVAHIIAQFAGLPRSDGVQIDFDATLLQRPFYRSLLDKVRSLLPAGTPISITALASWCLFDNWIEDLPVDETIPMMFSLGSERQKVLLYFQQQRDFTTGPCCRSLGLSLEDKQVNDLMVPLATARKTPVRLYFFSRTAWTPEKVQLVRNLLSKNEKTESIKPN